MACGCVDRCSCSVIGQGIVNVSGSGDFATPYVVTASESPFAATNTDGAISITPGGTAGHTPNLDLVIDPASTAPVSVSATGLKVDCCTSLQSSIGSMELDDIQFVINGTTDKLINWSLDIENDAAVIDVDAPGGLITVAQDGLYLIGIQIAVTGTAAASEPTLWLYLNGAPSRRAQGIVGSITRESLGFRKVMSLSAGDVLEAYVESDAGTISVHPGTSDVGFLEAVLLGA